MQSWLGQRQADDLAIGDWVAAEFSSVLSIELSAGQMRATSFDTSLLGQPPGRSALPHP